MTPALMADRRRLYVAATIRAIGAGMAGPLLGLHLASVDHDPAFLGVVVGTGLAGAALAAFLISLGADRWGRRSTIAVLCVLTAVGGGIVACGGPSWLVLVAAFFGMLNGMGKDRGAIPVLESATTAVPHGCCIGWGNKKPYFESRTHYINQPLSFYYYGNGRCSTLLLPNFSATFYAR